jgi:hypothetical protein
MYMALTKKLSVALLSIAAVAFASEKERPPFKPGPISSYPSRQTIQKVTIAADPVATHADAEPAFGKTDPNDFGILPVLVIIENGTGQTLSLERMKVELLTPDRQHVLATPASELKYLRGAERPSVYTIPIPGAPPRVSKKKNKLAEWQIEGRAFSARMLPPNETASGFFYFQAPYRGGSSLYVTGLQDARTGEEIFYFEIPLDKK